MSSKRNDICPEFGNANGRNNRPMKFCMITNMGIERKIPDMEARAKIYVQNSSVEYVGMVSKYVQSGLSQDAFKAMIFWHMGVSLQNGYARNLQIMDEGCAVFEADTAILQNLRQSFPLGNFTVGVFDTREERDESYRNYLILQRDSMQDRNLIPPRPYLDA